MTDDRREGPEERRGWTEAGLDAVVGWFPGLPKWIKVFFASATIYLILCFVSKIPPMALPQTVGDAARAWIAAGREQGAQERIREDSERADIIKLLLDERAELRAQAADLRSQIRPDNDYRIKRLEERAEAVDAKLQSLLDAHPRVQP